MSQFNARLVKTTFFLFQIQSGTLHKFHLIFFPPNWQQMSIFSVELKTLKKVNWHMIIHVFAIFDLFTTTFWLFSNIKIATIYGARLDLFAATNLLTWHFLIVVVTFQQHSHSVIKHHYNSARHRIVIPSLDQEFAATLQQHIVW